MVMVDVDSSSLPADLQPMAWSGGWQPSGTESAFIK